MITSLESLRFLFAIMIFLHHFPVNGEGLFTAGGPCGVVFFMVLSGFVMSAGYANKVNRKDFDCKSFMTKRLARLYPLHIICLIGFIGVRIIVSADIDWLSLLPNALLVQSWIPIKEIYFSGNAVSWCLADMVFFYLMFPLIIRIKNSLNIKHLIVVCATIFIVYIILINIIPEHLTHALIYINPLFRIVDFIIGILLYDLYEALKDNKRVKKVYSSARNVNAIEIGSVVLLVLSLLAYPHIDNRFGYVMLFWLPSSVLIISAALSYCHKCGLVGNVLNNRVLYSMGGGSFTFYMIHQMFIGYMLAAMSKVGLNICWPIQMVIVFTTTLIASILINKYVEKPIANLLIKQYR